MKTLIVIFLSGCLFFACEGRLFTTKETRDLFDSHFERLDDVIDILNNNDETVILYTNFNDGQYLEYYGYHPYIDGRAELFYAKNNQDYDYFSEYISLLDGSIYYRDFIDNYKFNYLILSRKADSYMYTSLLHDDDFELIYESPDVNLFVRK